MRRGVLGAHAECGRVARQRDVGRLRLRLLRAAGYRHPGEQEADRARAQRSVRSRRDELLLATGAARAAAEPRRSIRVPVRRQLHVQGDDGGAVEGVLHPAMRGTDEGLQVASRAVQPGEDGSHGVLDELPQEGSVPFGDGRRVLRQRRLRRRRDVAGLCDLPMQNGVGRRRLQLPGLPGRIVHRSSGGGTRDVLPRVRGR
mmetsp:Transcript_11670/g.45292  ORF Transcript_11670/g.45292 Transcript_11670/m.45292 type:complete len:201 (+) Transcript_11670:702-1304(+)